MSFYSNSFNSPFWNFFDNINDEVNQFNRLLSDTGLHNRVRASPKAIKTNEGSSSSSNDSFQLQNIDKNTISVRDPFGLPTLFSSSLLNSNQFNIIPPVDVLDNKDNYELHVSVPGAKKDDIHIDFNPDNNQVEITGEIARHREDSNLKLKERFTGSFSRVIRLPTGTKLDENNIKANYSAGVLTLIVAKAVSEQGRNTKRIEISCNESSSSSDVIEEVSDSDQKGEKNDDSKL